MGNKSAEGLYFFVGYKACKKMDRDRMEINTLKLTVLWYIHQQGGQEEY